MDLIGTACPAITATAVTVYLGLERWTPLGLLVILVLITIETVQGRELNRLRDELEARKAHIAELFREIGEKRTAREQHSEDLTCQTM
jgi:hypothetical protein